MLSPKIALWLGRIPACLVVATAFVFVIASIWFDSFTWELFSKGLYFMPSRVGGNWVQVVLLFGIFVFAQLLTLWRDGWKLVMTGRLLENVWIGVLSSMIGWVGLFFYSTYLEKRKIESTAAEIPYPHVPVPSPPPLANELSIPDLVISMRPLEGIQIDLEAASGIALRNKTEYEMILQNNSGTPIISTELMMQLPAPLVLVTGKIAESHGAVGTRFDPWPQWTAVNGGIQFKNCPASLNYRF